MSSEAKVSVILRSILDRKLRNRYTKNVIPLDLDL